MFWLMLKPEATEISKQKGKGQNAFIENTLNTQYARLNVVNRGAQILVFLLYVAELRKRKRRKFQGQPKFRK
jgi:hypothetical protein